LEALKQGVAVEGRDWFWMVTATWSCAIILSNHKRLSVKLLIEAAGATLAFLPPYSPDLNPIEKAFTKLKAKLRRIGERTISGLWEVNGSLVTMFNAQECQNCFASWGYDAH
jgi:transposase